jgi:hypothetical protein
MWKLRPVCTKSIKPGVADEGPKGGLLGGQPHYTWSPLKRLKVGKLHDISISITGTLWQFVPDLPDHTAIGKSWPLISRVRPMHTQ